MKKRLLSLMMVLAMLATLLPAGMVTVGAAEDTVTNIVCVGDSLTAGSGSTNGQTYPAQLQNLLGSGYKVTNAGLGGRTMGNYANENAQYTYGDDTNGDKKPSDGEEHYGNGTDYQVTKSTIAAADAVIIMLGTNDTTLARWPADGEAATKENYVSAYKTMIDTFVKWNSDIQFILATPPASKQPAGNDNNWGSPYRLNTVSGWVKGDVQSYIKDKGNSVQVIDIYSLTQALITKDNLWNVYTDSNGIVRNDTIHFNNAGYGELAKLYYETFWDTTVHSFTVDGVDADHISIDADAATIGIAADSVSGIAKVEVATNSTVGEVDLSKLTVESPITFTVTAGYDGNAREWTVYLTDDTADFEKTLIYNANQLKALQGKALDGDYKLMADIDLGTMAWSPITSLTGTFDGNGKTITLNTTVSANNTYGFIKTINAGSAVRNLTIAGSVNGNGYCGVGVFACENKGIIENCTNKASVTNVDSATNNQPALAAGIVSTNYGLVNNCANTAAVSGYNDYAVGIAAKLKPGSAVANCYNTGDITIALNGVGGIVGDASEGDGLVINCYNTGAIASSNTTDGRIVAGIVANANRKAMTIENCWNTGTITAKGEQNDIGCRITEVTQINNFTSAAVADDAVAKLNERLMTGFTYNGTLYDLNSWTQTNGVPAFGAAVTAMAQDETGAYHLRTKEHFDWWVNAVQADASVSAVLECDITLTGTWIPIANLTGTFDGKGHTISNLTITDATADFQGFFAEVTGGTVKNVNLTNVAISSSKTKIGGIAGRVRYGTIANCTVTGTISSTHEGGSSNVGGIVGEAGGVAANAVVIDGCISHATITITHNNENDKNVAGIVGQAAMNSNAGSVIRNCVNTGTVTGVADKSKKVAGIAGETYFSIVNCYNTGTILGKADIAGVVGVSYNANTYLANCYNAGAISASGNRGGIAGRVNMSSHMVNCYSLDASGVTSNVHTAANASNNYYCSTATAGKQGATAKTIEEMKTADFVRVLNNYVIENKDDEVLGALQMSKWTKGEDGYPVLTGTPAGADDVVDNTSQIENAAQLLAINGKSDAYTLANDITITEADAAQITVEYLVDTFRGTLNGNGKTITIACNKMLIQFLYGSVSDLTIKATINLPDNTKIAPFARYCYAGSLTNCIFDGSVTAKDFPSGIVSNVYSGSVIDNCSTTETSTVTAVATSGYHYAAGIVSSTGDWGNNEDIVIRNCVNQATVTAGNDYCGGIVGCVGNTCAVVVDHCTNKGAINGKNATAGIVAAGEGQATLIITNCQNNASVSGGNYAGGIVGRAQANLQLYLVNNSSVGSMSGTTGGLVQTIRGNVVAYLENNYSYNNQNMKAFDKTQDTATVFVSNSFAWWNAAGTNAAGYQQALESTMKSVGFVLTLDSYVPGEDVQTVLTQKNITLKTWDAVEGATPVLGTAAIGSKGGIKYDGETLLIGNDLQLQYFAAQVSSDATLSARLTADILLTGNWNTIATTYNGTFDGNGYTISGFKQTNLASGNVGMFKELAATGTIKNLTLAGHIDCPNAENFGAIVATNNGLVYGCTNKVNVVDEPISRDETDHLTTEGGKGQIGGLVGLNNGTIDSCVNEGIVTAFKDYAGGIAGYGKANSLVVNCVNRGEVAHTPKRNGDGGSGTGGILGGTGSGVKAYVINCVNKGYIYDNNDHRGYLGGIIGDRGFAYNCYNAGHIWYKGNASGGYGISGRQNDGALEHCYTAYRNNNDKNNGTLITVDVMKEADFALTLNEGVSNIAGDYLATVTSKKVTLSNWSQGEDQLPAFGLTVQFYGKSNILLAAKSVLSVSQLEQVLEATKAPALGGYAFESWDTEITDVNELWATGISGKMSLTAKYVKSPTAKDYTITVTNATATNGNEDPIISGDTQLAFDDRVTVVAATNAGSTFSYWLLDGAKVGFGQTSYTFYVSGNNVIEAVFDATAEQNPEVVLQQATFAADSEGRYTLSVIAQTSIPNGYTVESYGMYYTGSASVIKALAENAESVDAGKYVQVVSSKTDAGEQYMTHLMNVGVDKTRYARAYAVVKNASGDQQILWSTAVYQFKTTTDGVTIIKGAIG